jgi:hypothetical protein
LAQAATIRENWACLKTKLQSEAQR